MAGILSTVLIVEGDSEQKARVRDGLYHSCLCDRIIHFSTGQDMMNFFSGGRPDQSRWDVAQAATVIDASDPIDAYEILVQLKNNPELSKMPVIVLANSSHDAFRFYSAGCSFYVVKPADYSALMHCIGTIGAVLSMSSTRLPRIAKHNVQAKISTAL